MATIKVVTSDTRHQLDELVSTICEALDKTEKVGTKKRSDKLDDWATKTQDIMLGVGIEGILDEKGLFEFRKSFEKWEVNQKKKDEEKEFGIIEAFVLDEQNRGRQRRAKARVAAAADELQMAVEIAELKGFRNNNFQLQADQELQDKISDAERAYVNRKMVVAKAAQLANADCRTQFSRVRAFFENMHLTRQEVLREQYDRSRKVMAVTHKLCNTDSRVRKLEEETAERIYRNKESNLNELHMAQNLEEAVYLEAIIDLLERVQVAKEGAATEMFQLQVQDLKDRRKSLGIREKNLSELRAESTIEMAKLVAHYVEENAQNNEDDEQTMENVATTERGKDFRANPQNTVVCVSELYDTIVWSVATSSLGLSTTGTSHYSSEFYSDELGDGENNDVAKDLTNDDTPLADDADTSVDNLSANDASVGFKNDDGSIQSGATADTTQHNREEEALSLIGNIHMKQLTRDLKVKERTLIKKHNVEMKEERRKYRQKYREVKKRNQQKVDEILNYCVQERYKLREEITQRMQLLTQNQEASTLSLQNSIEEDVKAMQDAWAEHRRLENAEKRSFAKAQALISAQVFHEVRNALSSVVAMSEMTKSLQEDPSTTPDSLVSSVNEMLDQNKEVVNYALNMLNNILDVNKIKTGSFKINKTAFDLGDLVKRATKMQQVKAQTRGVSMSCKEYPASCIAYTDDDIVSRIMTNFISNAVKFTSAGAIQPFVVPAEEVMNADDTLSEVSNGTSDYGSEDGSLGYKTKMMALGVADTGPGLSKQLLDIAEKGLYNSDTTGTTSGAKNSGFGLHLAHQLARTLGTKVYLADLKDCQSIFNEDMAKAFASRKSEMAEVGTSHMKHGTVLYITLFVYEDEGQGREAVIEMSDKLFVDRVDGMPPVNYKFSPLPPLMAGKDKFHILVADDVFMLRKGMVRSILQTFNEFTDCPIAVYTACSAEEVLRLVSRHAFDMIICDNQFNAPDNTSKAKNKPSHIEFSTGCNIQKLAAEYFRSEALVMEEGDFTISGLTALINIVDTPDKPHPTPLLMLLSGHKITLDPTYGIIVVQKPLKTSELLPTLESNVNNLIVAGQLLIDEADDGRVRIVNKNGSQLFSI